MSGLLPSGQGLGSPWSDRETERALELVDIEGMTFKQASKRMQAEGFPERTRNAMIGHVWRVRQALKRSE